MKNAPSSFEPCPIWEDFPDIDLYMDQVISILERRLEPFLDSEEKSITPTMINNYVKHKILPPPVNKRYRKTQLTALFMLCILKRFMQLSDGSALIENLVRLHGEEGAYRLFSEELTRAMSSETQGNAPPCDATHAALRGACVAFAAITFAKISYLAAEDQWRSAAEKKLLREKKEKEKTKDKAKEKSKEKTKEKEKDKKDKK